MKKAYPLTVPLLAIATCFLWSTEFVGIKIGLKYARPLSFAGVSFMLAGLLVLPFCGNLLAFLKTVRTNLRTVVLVGFLQTFLLYGLLYTGMTMVSGALGAITVGSSPLFAALVAHFTMPGDRMRASRMLTIFMGIAGVALIAISRQPWTMAGLIEFAGVLLVLLGCIASAVGNIFVARDGDNINPLVLNCAQIFIGGVLLLLLSLPVEGIPALHYPWEFYVALLWLAFVSAVAFSLWFVLLKRDGIRVSELNIWKFVIPVFGAILSWVILPDESPSLLPVVGMLLVAASIFTSAGALLR